MLLEYHGHLLNDSLPKNYFKRLHKFSYVNSTLLREGLFYTDVPCSSMILTNDNKLKFLNYKSCKMPLSLIYLFYEDENGHQEVVQSHRGKQAIGHSMTYDPNISMIDMRQKILRRLEILYMLALNDTSLMTKSNDKKDNICYSTLWENYTCLLPQPNIFWLGQILHCIQDSYSRAHTLRILPGQQLPTIKNKFPRYKKKDANTHKLIRKIGAIINKLDLNVFQIPNNIPEFLKKYIKKETLINIIDNDKKNISHIFRLILFFKLQEQRFNQLFDGKYLVMPSNQNKTNNSSIIKHYPYIVSFRYIKHQEKCNLFFHMKYDVKETNDIYEKYIIKNGKDILKMYKRHILDNNSSIQDKINEMITYIAKNTFPIPQEYHHLPSAFATDCELDFENVYDNLKH